MRVWVLGFLLAASAGWGQQDVPHVPKVVPIPVPKVPMRAPDKPADPTEPAARTVEDARARVTFRLPAGWNMERRDGELSTFRLDARTAARSAQLRVVANMGWNPFPHSTFSGALFYLSVAPRLSAAQCAAETTSKPDVKIPGAVIDDVKFARGKDEHGVICTEARDIAYTTERKGMCVRFDLAVNTFCGGQVSGAQDITNAELGEVFGRMEGILQTVKFVRP